MSNLKMGRRKPVIQGCYTTYDVTVFFKDGTEKKHSVKAHNAGQAAGLVEKQNKYDRGTIERVKVNWL
jgi:hypothetical protein